MNGTWWTLLWVAIAVIKLQNAPLLAQAPFAQAPPVVVIKDADTLHNAWAGGLNNPQFWDIRNSIGPDFLVFDREGDQLLAFNEINGQWRPADWTVDNPFTHWLVPVPLQSGQTLYVTGNFQGRTRAYFPVANGRRLSFTPVFDSLTFTDQGSTKILTVGFIDIPGFADVNGDGDVDIINFEPLGGYIDYFENQAVERGGNEADFAIELVDRCWGEFYESGVTRSVALDSCVDDRFGKQPPVRHAGSTVSVVDLNNDALYDVVLGDLNFSTLVQLTNGGTPTVADMISQDTLFPANNPVDIPNFPGSFFMAIDGDSLLDFLAAPNSQSGSADVEQVWYYRNTGTAQQPQFTLQQKDFLVGSMIDVGTNAYPALWDYNGDNLLDLVIGCQQRRPDNGAVSSGLALYANTGTATAPAFTWVTNDFGNLRGLGLSGISPTFSDLDNDGQADMVIGDADGRLHYFRNTALPGQPATFLLTGPQWFSIDVGSNAAPFLTDRNGDGLVDLLVGERNGNVNLFLNNGTASTPQFNTTPDEQVYGGIDVRQGGLPFGQSRPMVLPIGTQKEEIMLVGTQLGHLFHYTDLQQNTFTLVDSSYAGLDVGNIAAPAAGDLNGDGLADLIVGTSRGGVQLYYQTAHVGQPERQRPTFTVYPNPADHTIRWQLDTFKGLMTYSIWHATGQLVGQGTTTSTNLSVQHLSPGCYWLTLSGSGYQASAMFIKQ